MYSNKFKSGQIILYYRSDDDYFNFYIIKEINLEMDRVELLDYSLTRGTKEIQGIPSSFYFSLKFLLEKEGYFLGEILTELLKEEHVGLL